MFELADEHVDALSARLAEVGYTVAGVADTLGPVGHAALDRNETTPGRLRVGGDGPLATLVRLWSLQGSVPERAVQAALPGLLEPLLAAGICDRSGGEVDALVEIRPYGDEDHDWWLVADLTPGLDGRRPLVPADHVLGLNSAATSLAQLTVRRPVGTALDLGTGCGIQALHLAGHADRVVATDVNPRALAMARLTARLNAVHLDLRAGSYFEPVHRERFDLVVSNPPFVVSPGGAGGGLTYRDSGLPGDEACRRLVGGVAARLADGGVCQLLANWVHRRGESWSARVGGWFDGAPLDAWVVQREVCDPAAYVEVWLKDAGQHGGPGYRERYESWLRWFDDQGVEGVGFGWIVARRTGAEPTVRVEDWPHPVRQPLAPAVAGWLEAVTWLDDRDELELGGSRLRVRADVESEQVGPPGASDPSRIVLRQLGGLRRARRVDTAEAGLVGACDGTLSLDQIVRALGRLLPEDPGRLQARLYPRVRELVAEGYLEPAP